MISSFGELKLGQLVGGVVEVGVLEGGALGGSEFVREGEVIHSARGEIVEFQRDGVFIQDLQLRHFVGSLVFRRRPIGPL